MKNNRRSKRSGIKCCLEKCVTLAYCVLVASYTCWSLADDCSLPNKDQRVAMYNQKSALEDFDGNGLPDTLENESVMYDQFRVIGIPAAVTNSPVNSGAGGDSWLLGGIGLLDDGEMAGIEVSLTGPGVLSFDWKVSSEADWDVLSFYEVGSDETNCISGTGGEWERVSVTLGGERETVHTFRWEYEKDPIGDYVGEDCGWIDSITWFLDYLYPLTVNNGSGSGSYLFGSNVEIAADYQPGKIFYRWIGDVDTVANVMQPTTTVQTVDGAISVTATYSVPVTVNNGSGAGWYPVGSVATVTADPDPMYMEFIGWTGNTAGQLDDPSSPSAQLTVPDEPASVTASYATSISRVAGCYRRKFTESGSSGGLSMDVGAGSPSDTPAVMLGGSGVVPDNGFAAMETEVWGSGTISFWWKVSSERDADYLKFKVDDCEIASISGTKVPWVQVSQRVEGAGLSHRLRWEYVKDGSLASSTDAGWVDDIIWAGDVPDPVISPDIRNAAVTDSVFSLSFLGERGMPYIVCSNSVLGADGWLPMDITPLEAGETNGLFRYLFEITRPLSQSSCFYTVAAASYENNVTFVNWDGTVLKTERVVYRGSATAPAVNPTRPADTFYEYAFTGWDAAFNNIHRDLTVTAQYEATRLPPPDGMVRIPAGTNSGTNPLEAGESYDSYYPENYSLTVDTFCMDATEVTKAQWDVVYNWAVSNGYSFDNAGSGKASNHPVHTVNWYDCVKWCNARSEREGRTPCYTVSGSVYRGGQSSPSCNFSANGYRLPTNDEWEYAARGGLSGKRFPWGDTITHSYANYKSWSGYNYDVSSTRGNHPDYDDGGYPYTSPVGDFEANGYGLYDMAGNVREWCNDASGSYRYIRGGSWRGNAARLRCGREGWDYPGIAGDSYGFRAVCR